MSSGCGDVLSLADLQTAKKHQIFEAEVITGKSGGVAGGTNIDYATNPVTLQTQKTMPAILRDIGFQPASFDFTSGGTLTTDDRNKAVLWPLADGGDGDWYYWEGALPKVIPAASTPASTGGVAEGAWRPVGDITLRRELASTNGAQAIGTLSGGSVQDELTKLPLTYIAQQKSPITITVGPSGDFSTINDAITSVAKYQYVLASGNTGIRITLLSGFLMEEQVIVDFLNLSFIEIYSTSVVHISRAALTTAVEGYYPAFCAKNSAVLPKINASFDMGWTSGAQDQSVAFLAYGAGSAISIASGKGCIRSYGFGILASNGAMFSADGTVWDDCAGDGVSVYAGGSGSAKNATANRCYNGFVANGGVLDATSSVAKGTRSAGFAARKSGVLNAEFADAQNGVTYGFYSAVSSMLNATRGNCSGCRFGISAQRSSKVAAEEVTADNCLETNISARRYSEIEAQSCHAVNTTTTPLYCIRANYSGSVVVESGTIGGACTHNICRATTNAEIQATDTKMSGAIGTSIAVFVDESSNFNGRRMNLNHSTSEGTAVHVLRGSTADISDSTIVAGNNYGVVSQYCANVAADNAKVNGSSDYSVYATDGGKISVTNSNVRRDNSTDQNTDIVISRGGIISAFGALGGVNTTVNAVSEKGIIFK